MLQRHNAGFVRLMLLRSEPVEDVGGVFEVCRVRGYQWQ